MKVEVWHKFGQYMAWVMYGHSLMSLYHDMNDNPRGKSLLEIPDTFPEKNPKNLIKSHKIP